MGSSPFNFAVTISIYAQMMYQTHLQLQYQNVSKYWADVRKLPKNPKPEFVGHFEGSIQLQSPPFGGVSSAVRPLYW